MERTVSDVTVVNGDRHIVTAAGRGLEGTSVVARGAVTGDNRASSECCSSESNSPVRGFAGAAVDSVVVLIVRSDSERIRLSNNSLEIV